MRRNFLSIFWLGLLFYTFNSYAVDIDYLKQGNDFHIIYDEQNQYNINEVIRSIHNYPKLNNNYIELSFSSGTVWLATKVSTLELGSQPLALEVNNSKSQDVEFYLFKDNQAIIQQHYLTQPHKLRHHSPLFQFSLTEDGDFTVLLKLKHVHSGTQPLLWQQTNFYNHLVGQLPLKGAFIGILLALALYNLITFFGVRHIAYVWYSSYIVLTILWRSLFSDFGSIYIGDYLYNQLYPFTYSFVLLAIAFACLFGVDFINLKRYSRKITRLIYVLISLSVFLASIVWLMPPAHAMLFISGLTIVAGPILLFSAIYCWRQGQLSARFYVFSYFPLLVAVGYTQLTIWQILPNSAWRTDLLDLAILSEALLLTVALADKLRQNEKEKVFLATHDPLTRLPNRNLVYKELAHYKSYVNFTLLQIDLSNLNAIRNTLGLKAADRLLCLFSERLSQWSRKQKNALSFEYHKAVPSQLAQLERGSFIFAVRGSSINIQHLSEEIKEVIRKPIEYHSITISSDCYIGAVYSHLHGNTVEQLVQNVNIAANLASQKQLPLVLYSDEKNLYTERRLALMADLKKALTTSTELNLYFQPQVNLQTNEIIGAEALVRWQHKDHGRIYPSEFVPLAEESGLINELTLWVLREALEINQCIDKSIPGHIISVNISVYDLELDSFSFRVKELLKKSYLPAEQLLLEVTESAMISDPGQVHLVLELVNQMGIKTSIDDFGTGYSSLSYLSLLPVNELKIDKSFIVGIADKQQNYTITENILNLAHNLNLTSVAEGIENEAAYETLKALKCNIGQGFYISEPLSLPNYLLWTENWQKQHSLTS